jgi:hypothetical protein
MSEYKSPLEDEIKENLKYDEFAFKITWAINQNWLDVYSWMNKVSNAIDNNNKIIKENSNINTWLTFIGLLLSALLVCIWFSQIIISLHWVSKFPNLIDLLITGVLLILLVFLMLWVYISMRSKW